MDFMIYDFELNVEKYCKFLLYGKNARYVLRLNYYDKSFNLIGHFAIHVNEARKLINEHGRRIKKNINKILLT